MSAISNELYTQIDSPIGPLLLTGTPSALTGLRMMGAHDYSALIDARTEDRSAFADAISQLHEYFAGERIDFELSLAASGTEFQSAVWAALSEIPYGETRSYGEIAASIGKPNAARAVGMANNRNPIAVIIPCHRVIGADGSMVGYGGGLQRKTLLLELEQSGSHRDERS